LNVRWLHTFVCADVVDVIPSSFALRLPVALLRFDVVGRCCTLRYGFLRVRLRCRYVVTPDVVPVVTYVGLDGERCIAIYVRLFTCRSVRCSLVTVRVTCYVVVTFTYVTLPFTDLPF